MSGNEKYAIFRIEEAIRTCVSALTKPLTVAIRGVYHDADDGHLYGGIPQGQNEVLCPLRKFVGKFVNICMHSNFDLHANSLIPMHSRADDFTRVEALPSAARAAWQRLASCHAGETRKRGTATSFGKVLNED